ncbi:MAG: hypothetical protein ACE5JO_05735 [Candidatus Binatia bacterium]
MGLEGEEQEQVKEVIQKKDRSGLEEILGRSGPDKYPEGGPVAFSSLFRTGGGSGGGRTVV